MAPDIVRDSTLGQLINWATSGRVLPYRDQRPDYVVPSKYLSSAFSSRAPTVCAQGGQGKPQPELADFSRRSSAGTLASNEQTPVGSPAAAHKNLHDIEKDLADAERGQDVPEVPDQFLVTWEGDDDPDNPKNWSPAKRGFVLFLIGFLTFSVYIGSAIFTPAIPGIMEEFGTTLTVATLGLTLYVAMYGIGPMLWSPLQEMPIIGRNPVYIATLFLFVVLQVPVFTANNVATLLVFRGITGFVGSPALATGGASVADIYTPSELPYTIALWAISAVCGPVIGPVIGSVAAQAHNWRWPMYELILISGVALVLLTLVFPETYEPTILLRRARRLRKLTGNPHLRSASEIEQAKMRPSDVMYEAMLRPILISFDPALLYVNLYIAMLYSIFYLWFESFALVYRDIYGFSLGASGLPFLCFVVSGMITYVGYCLYIKYHLNPRYERAGWQLPPEVRLEAGIFTALLTPISLFIFGWTSREDIHWIVPTIGAALFLTPVFIAFQSILLYLAMAYPKYGASVLASNDLFRSVIAACLPLAGEPLFHNLGIGPGNSLLAGISILLATGLPILYKYGASIRKRSKYATA